MNSHAVKYYSFFFFLLFGLELGNHKEKEKRWSLDFLEDQQQPNYTPWPSVSVWAECVGMLTIVSLVGVKKKGLQAKTCCVEDNQVQTF